MKKTLTRLLSGALLIIVLLIAWNYFSVWRPVSQALGKNPRNQAIKVATYHQYLINPSTLVFDLRNVSGDASQNGILLALLQSAEALNDKSFDRVILAYKGKAKFQLTGEYFQKLGEEFPWQNFNYTMFTFSENVRTLNDSPAFKTWTGGGLGLMNKQLEDLNSMHQSWYVSDLAKAM